VADFAGEQGEGSAEIVTRQQPLRSTTDKRDGFGYRSQAGRVQFSKVGQSPQRQLGDHSNPTCRGWIWTPPPISIGGIRKECPAQAGRICNNPQLPLGGCCRRPPTFENCTRLAVGQTGDRFRSTSFSLLFHISNPKVELRNFISPPNTYSRLTAC
jgi:hypothetical protein